MSKQKSRIPNSEKRFQIWIAKETIVSGGTPRSRFLKLLWMCVEPFCKIDNGIYTRIVLVIPNQITVSSLRSEGEIPLDYPLRADAPYRESISIPLSWKNCWPLVKARSSSKLSVRNMRRSTMPSFTILIAAPRCWKWRAASPEGNPTQFFRW